MGDGPSVEEAPAWAAAVQVHEEPELARELWARLGPDAAVRSVGVTDLLALRRAYWRVVGPPVAVPEERRVRMERGRFLHRTLGRILAREAALEVRVRHEGLVGRIDVLTDRPIEVKTTAHIVEAETLLSERPEYVEQLGMYCALVGIPNGRVLSLTVREDGSVGGVRAAEVRFRDIDAIREEMRRRAALLRECWASRTPDRLPRCPWFDRGCEFRAGPTCDCTGAEASASSPILAEVASIAPAADFADRVARGFDEQDPADRPPSIARFRDLIYPRRAYFERTRPLPAARAPAPLPASEVYARLVEAVEGGPVGEVARLPELAPEPEEEVPAFRGAPYLLRTSRARRPPPAAELVARAPQYALELGFRCAATGRTQARAVVAYERVERESDALRVFRFDFDPITIFSRLWREREALFREALERGTPERLPPCPAWMADDCPYRSECGCGAAPARSQR